MMNIEIGVYDSPQTQEIPRLKLNLLKSNIAVFGGPMSGKSTFVKTLLVRLHQMEEQLVEQQIYIIDFGGNIGDYAKLKNVCACFDNYNEEDTKGIFKTVGAQLTENIKQLNNRSYLDVYQKDPSQCPPHMLLIIENINAFLADERYASYQETLTKFCRDGLSKGLTVLFTAFDMTGGITRLLPSFGSRFAFEMPPERYFDIFNTKVFPPMRLQGRGIATVDTVPHEFQCFLPFEKETEELPAFIEQSNQRTDFPVKKMVSLPTELTSGNLAEYAVGDALSDGGHIALGLDYYSHEPVKLDYRRQNVVGIYGKREFGKTNLLRLMMQGLLGHHRNYRYIFVDDGRQQLTKIYEETRDLVASDDLAVYLTDYDQLKTYLLENGYTGKPKTSDQPRAAAGRAAAAAAPAPKSNSLLALLDAENMVKQTANSEPEVSAPQSAGKGANPPTVFVLQNKGLTNAINGGFLKIELQQLVNDADEKEYFFIYSDLRGKITDPELQSALNNTLAAAFVLDNLGEFVADKGSRTVFGEMDVMELKAQYAKCILGDGYYYDIERDELCKMKLIKAEESLAYLKNS